MCKVRKKIEAGGMLFCPDRVLDGVWQIVPHVIGDARGYFMESYKPEAFRSVVADVTWVQENESFSRRGVLRGLHYQAGEWSQAKLIRVTEGKIVDVAVDLREGSATYGKATCVELSSDNHVQMFIPRGFAHGFVVLSEVARFQYKVDNVYHPQAEHTLMFNDPALGIEWPLGDAELVLSEKDKCGIMLKDVKPFAGLL